MRRALLHTLLLASPALAGDFYVDAVHGDDLATGGVADPWRTLTHALSTIPAPPAGEGHTLHVASGLHDANLGEVFPISPPGWLTLVGAGPDHTRLDAGGVATTVLSLPQGGEVSGLEVTGGESGIAVVVPDQKSATAALADLRVTNMTGTGVYLSAGQLIGWWGTVHATLEGVEVSSCQRGVVLSVYGDYPYGTGYGTLAVTNSDLSGNVLDGLRISRGFKDEVDADVVRCTLTDNGGNGVVFFGQDGCCGGVGITDSLVARNGSCGVLGFSDTGDAIVISRTTLVENTFGVQGVGIPVYMDACLLAGNDDDLRANHVAASYCLIEDGDLAGQDNNFSADPGFVDAAAGDWRLRQDSPAVDAGPIGGADLVDLVGRPRDIDGDLDTVGAVDVGAYERATLVALASEVSPGASAQLEVWGPAGNTARVLWHRGPLLDAAELTPWGALFLDRARVSIAGSAVAGPGPPGSFDFVVPGDPGLIGTTLGLQALIATGQPGWALSNPETLLVVP